MDPGRIINASVYQEWTCWRQTRKCETAAQIRLDICNTKPFVWNRIPIGPVHLDDVTDGTPNDDGLGVRLFSIYIVKMDTWSGFEKKTTNITKGSIAQYVSLATSLNVRSRSEIARALSQHCSLHTRSGGLNWCSNRNLIGSDVVIAV